MLVCGAATPECLPGAGSPEAYEDNCPAILAILGRPEAAGISPAQLVVAPLKGTVRCCPGFP